MTSKWTVDCSGKVFVVTGANAGIGKEIARNLAEMNGDVILGCRSRERGQAAVEEIRRDTGSDRLHLVRVDLSSQSSIRRFCEQIEESFSRLDALINNAAVFPRRRRVTEDGIERTWAVNVIGYFMTTNHLLDLLLPSVPSRVVNVASRYAGDLRLDDLQFEKRSFNGRLAYKQSKQANRMLSWVLADRLRGTGVTVNACHPGSVATQLYRDQPFFIRWPALLYMNLFAKSPREGADTPTWLAVSPMVEGVTGKFWENREDIPRTFDNDRQNQELWERCEGMIR